MRITCLARSAVTLSVAFALSCAAGATDGGPSPAAEERFKAHWYAGRAELTRYALEQSRYGETHRGDAVLIFVTEDFLPDAQVKYEGGRPRVPPLSVLKLNFTRKFHTGVYPYSTMTSVFTPVAAREPTLKATASIQEWCGHTYTQLNLRDGRYRGLLHSYFQDEADAEFQLEGVLLEDEVWNRIRLAPEALPTGEIEIVPGLQFARFSHKPSSVERAKAHLGTARDPRLSDGSLKVYRLDYVSIPRVVEITFEAAFPYSIVAWEERAARDPGDPEAPTTRAVKTHSLMLDYWKRNSVGDASYRESLGLE